MRSPWWIVSLVSLLFLLGGAADAEALEPARVRVVVVLFDVFAIDDDDQTFEADFTLSLSWRDDRVTRVFGAADWRPNLQFANAREIQIHEFRPLGKLPNGEQEIAFRVRGRFDQRFDLRRFPNDTQRLSIELIAPSLQEGFQLEAEGVVRKQIGELVSGWTVSNMSVVVDEIPALIEGRRDVMHMLISVDVERDPRFYLWRVVVPLCLIVFMSWTVFWIEPTRLDAQLEVSCAAVITLIAFELSLTYVLPQVSYLTSLDLFVLGATLMVFAALGECVWTSSLSERGRREGALRVDRYARRSFPALFSALLIGLWLVS